MLVKISASYCIHYNFPLFNACFCTHFYKSEIIGFTLLMSFKLFCKGGFVNLTCYLLGGILWRYFGFVTAVTIINRFAVRYKYFIIFDAQGFYFLDIFWKIGTRFYLAMCAYNICCCKHIIFMSL